MHRRYSVRITRFAAFLLLFFFTATSGALAAEFVSVSKDGVNIRSGPSTKNKVLWEVFKDFPLKILKRDGNWANVEDYEGDTGWIYEPLVSKETMVIVKVDTANMRSGPGKENNVIATVKKGVVFKPVAREGNWIKVSYQNDLTGWIYKTLLWPPDPF